MWEKKGGTRIEDFLSEEEIKACKKAQEAALPLLPALYKIADLDENIARLNNSYQKIDQKITKELLDLEKSFQNKFDKLISSNLDTNNSINTLSNSIDLLCQRLDTSVKDNSKLEKNINDVFASFRSRLSDAEKEQKSIRIDLAKQAGISMTAKQFIPTLGTIVAIVVSIYAALK